MKKFFIYTVFLLTIFFPGLAGAKTLYVDPNGNDSVTYTNNSITSPWRTIGRATWGSTNREARNGAEAARAGDIVIVNAGTYSGVGTNSRNEILYYQENSGTAGNPITFKANGTVNLTQTGAGAMIGSYRRNYIIWDGFTINEATAMSVADTGPVTVYECTGCVLQNLNINGNGDGNGRMDNHNGIRIEGSNNITVRNNRIQNVYTDHNVYNGACIMTYASQGLVIENNHFSECGSGVFIKGGPFSTAITNTSYIRYNLFENVYENRGGDLSGGCIALHAGAPYTSSAPILIYQNVMKNCGWAGVRIWAFDSVNPLNNPTNAKIFNNVIDTATNGIWVTGSLMANSGHQFWNNIITNTTGDAIAFGTSPSENIKSRFDSEHNLFFGNASIAQDAPGTRYTLATWKTTGQDSATTESVNANPLFVNSGANNYRLQSGSPANTLGRVIYGVGGSNGSTIPAGAYITGSEVIGLTSAGTVITPPPVIPTPTADIQLNGSNSTQTVTAGTSLSLTWTSTNSTSCSVTPGNFSGTSGTQTVTPTSNTTYTLNCSGNGGSASDSIAVTVNTVVVPPTDTSWVFCANENAQCLFTGTKEVRYGANNTYSYLTLTGGTTCSNNVFGDPVLNVVKQCYYRDTNSNVDTTVPVISITSPANSSTVSGTITVIATASDNTGVSGVQFKVNNSNLGIEDTVSPYSYSLNTTTLSNGTHTIYAVARDSAGNRATSTISATVNNQSQPIPTPTADIQLNGSNSTQTVTAGTSLSLTWTSTNSTSCSVTPGNFSGTSGTQTVTPTSNTTYTLNCSGNGGSASDSIAVTVNTVVVPPTDTGSTVIKVGDRVITTATVNIRKTAGGKILGYQRNGSAGTVTEGPTNSGGRSWYKVNYSSGVDGWTASSFLSKAGTTTLSRQEIENQIASILILIKQLQEQLSKLR